MEISSGNNQYITWIISNISQVVISHILPLDDEYPLVIKRGWLEKSSNEMADFPAGYVDTGAPVAPIHTSFS